MDSPTTHLDGFPADTVIRQPPFVFTQHRRHIILGGTDDFPAGIVAVQRVGPATACEARCEVAVREGLVHGALEAGPGARRVRDEINYCLLHKLIQMYENERIHLGEPFALLGILKQETEESREMGPDIQIGRPGHRAPFPARHPLSPGIRTAVIGHCPLLRSPGLP
jgi:hypothetical protein